MKSYLTSQNGSALLGILVAIVIVAALVYGSSFFWPKDAADNSGTLENTLNTYDQARKDIDDIQANLDAKNEIVEEVAADKPVLDNNNLINISNIKAGDILLSPAVIEGEGAAFENTLIVELRNPDHETMVKEPVTVKAPEMGQVGPFKITLYFNFSSTKEGYLAVYEESAQDDGSEVNLVEIPVKFNENISEWQTYRNKKYGFEFMYPDEWIKTEEIINNSGNSGYIIKIKNESITDENIEISITEHFPNLPDFDTNAPVSGKKIDGKNTQINKFPEGYCDVLACSKPFIGIWTQQNNLIYTINFANTILIDGIYDQILLTFKFIN